jgi:CubicO group peptidase (beta-lactamase class C family)
MEEDAIREAIGIRSWKAIRENVFPGCVIGIARRAGARMVISSGRLTYEPDATPVQDDTVYDLASVTKSIPTASLSLTFIDTGRFSLPDRISSYLPKLKNDHGATIEDLLRYRVHGIPLSKLRVRTFEELRAHALERGFDAPPGQSVYTNLPAFILGLIVERVGEASIAELAQRYFFGPLSMQATTFFPSASDCAPTEIDERGEVRGLPHDESAYRFAVARRSAGHAGLFSTVPDLLNFFEALLRGKYPSIAEAASAGLGWQTEGKFLGSHASAGSFGKTGFTGTSVCADPHKGIAFVILSNRTFPKRPAGNAAINSFRSDIADIILAA